MRAPAATASWTILPVAGVMLLGCGASGNNPGFAILPDMAASVPYDAYDRNPTNPSGLTLMLPPEGSVPMGFMPFAYGSTPEEAERAGRELTNPLVVSPESLARAAVEFRQKCQVCHGPSGHGDGPIIGRFQNPANLTAAHAREMPDGRIFHVISRGQGIMPSHAVQVLPEDRWRLVLYVRKLQADAGPLPPTQATAEGVPDAPPTPDAAVVTPGSTTVPRDVAGGAAEGGSADGGGR